MTGHPPPKDRELDSKESITKNWFFLSLLLFGPTISTQEKNINSGINESFRNPDVEDFIGRFEREGRDAFDRRDEILKACRIEPGMAVADIGAGTDVFTRMFANAEGEKFLR
ncbi:MAG: hypothetical protein KDA84_21480 [Planctomycetaceae bacterium]|nr:hypothetical protein [Planctomycetaceae bacterium]